MAAAKMNSTAVESSGKKADDAPLPASMDSLRAPGAGGGRPARLMMRGPAIIRAMIVVKI